MFTIQVDEDIILHLLQEHHHRAVYKLLNENKDHIQSHMKLPIESIESIREFCVQSKKQLADNGDYAFLITFNGYPAGMINLSHRTHETISGYEMSYWLGKPFVGHGIITRSARTLTSFVFANLQDNRVFMGIRPSNDRSCAIAERLGFTLEGTLRQNDTINSEWIDHRIYAMLKQDWQLPHEPPILCHELDDKLNMQLVEQRHAQVIFDVIDRNRDHIGEFMPWVDETKSSDDTLEFVNESIEQYGKNDGWQTSIWHDNQLVGMIGYLSWNTINQLTEIGYWLAKSATGQGIMTRCAREYIRYAFETLKLNRVIIRCAVDNHASAGVAKRLGFTHEGIERQGIKLRSHYTDVHVFSLLAEEWQTK